MTVSRPVASQVARNVCKNIAILSNEGGGLSLPSGAIGAWYASDYQSSPRKLIPNAVGTQSVSQNLISLPRRRFSFSNYWQPVGATCVDDAATANDGTSEASTLVSSSGNWYMGVVNGGSLPAGTYTIAVWAKRNTGTDQVFAFTKDSASTRSSVKTATSSWQRFTYTFTLASTTALTQILICSSDGATQASLQIHDLELFAGSSDLGTATLDGHMVLGTSQYDTRISVASNEIDLSTQAWGQIQFPTSRNLSSNFTFTFAARKIAAATAYQSIISKMQSYQHLSIGEISGYCNPQFGGTNEVFNQQGSGLWSLNGKGYFIHTLRYDGTKLEWWLNDNVIHRTVGSYTNQTYRDLYVGITNTTSFYTGYKINSMALWDKALTDAEIVQAYQFLSQNATSDGLTINTTQRLMFFEGDSISNNGNNWPYLYGAASSPGIIGHNFAVAGSGISTMTARASVVDEHIPDNTSGRIVALSVLIGANDLLSLGASTWLSNLRTYLVARKNAGWPKIVLCTPTPRTQAGFNTERAAVLSTMRGWEGDGVVDDIIDFAADATMGPDAAASNTSLYSDGVHPTATGQQNLANIAATVLNAI